jgi:hypothetical protein
MRLVMEYVKTVRGAAVAGAGAGAGHETVQLDPDGFPTMPCPPSWKKKSKSELEKIYRSYLAQHYRTLRCRESEL